MRDSQPDPKAVVGSPKELRGNGRVSAPLDPLDRSHILRRPNRFPFPRLLLADEHAGLRRERRVSAPFSGIPPLSRNGRD